MKKMLCTLLLLSLLLSFSACAHNEEKPTSAEENLTSVPSTPTSAEESLSSALETPTNTEEENKDLVRVLSMKRVLPDGKATLINALTDDSVAFLNFMKYGNELSVVRVFTTMDKELPHYRLEYTDSKEKVYTLYSSEKAFHIGYVEEDDEIVLFARDTAARLSDGSALALPFAAVTEKEGVMTVTEYEEKRAETQSISLSDGTLFADIFIDPITFLAASSINPTEIKHTDGAQAEELYASVLSIKEGGIETDKYFSFGRFNGDMPNVPSSGFDSCCGAAKSVFFIKRTNAEGKDEYFFVGNCVFGFSDRNKEDKERLFARFADGEEKAYKIPEGTFEAFTALSREVAKKRKILYGEPPLIYDLIIEENLFSGVRRFSGDPVVYKEYITENNTKNISFVVYNSAGVRRYSVLEKELNKYHHVSGYTTTSDEGLLYVIGWSDQYDYKTGTYAHSSISSSYICKVDGNGNEVFRKEMTGPGLSTCYIYEKNGFFYLFGTRERPETDKPGVGDRTEVWMMKMKSDGEIADFVRISGSDFDSLLLAVPNEEGFQLNIRTQSNDGDYEGLLQGNSSSVEVRFTVNENLEIVDKLCLPFGTMIKMLGYLDGKPITSVKDLPIENFDAGTPDLVYDYKDFFLVVSTRIIGIHEPIYPFQSSTWFYTETIYSAYDCSGTLLWQASIEDFPGYDATLK